VAGIPAPLLPVAHAILQALEDVQGVIASLPPEHLWKSPGGAATIGFHVRHLAGSLDRLFTYARGEALTDEQRTVAKAEKEPTPEVTGADLLAGLAHAAEHALAQLRSTPEETLGEARTVGRDKLPSSVRGLLYHAGEHAARHAGQVVTTAKVLAGERA
jgi:hypothetical protein